MSFCLNVVYNEGVNYLYLRVSMSLDIEAKPKFGRIRSFIWPIHSAETKKFLPMCIMMFFVLFNYTILRNTKDALVITSSGPEVIPYIKSFIILPFSVLFVTIFAKLSNIMSKERLFYLVIGSFLLFFMTFAFYIYPNRDVLHASPQTIAYLKETYPNFQHFFPILCNWGNTVFYMCAELWGAIALNLLFWQFANEITRTTEARRFYAMFGFLGHTALMAAGVTAKYLCSLYKCARPGGEEWGEYLSLIACIVAVAGLSIIAIYRWMVVNVLTDPVHYDGSNQLGTNMEKTKLSLRQSFKHLMNSRYLLLIGFLVFSYGLTMNITGLMWKKQLQLQYPDPIAYSNFMGSFSFIIGIITVCLIFFFKGIVEKFGWLRGAIITPCVLLVTASIFFTFIFGKEQLSDFVSYFGVTTLMMAVFIATSQQILCKSAKYSMFDPTKEMAYIPLDKELKVKGKAAVDVTGHQFSKAAGGYLYIGLFTVFAASDLMEIAHYLAIIVLIVGFLWLGAVKELSTLYYNIVSTKKNVTTDKTQNSQKKTAPST